MTEKQHEDPPQHYAVDVDELAPQGYGFNPRAVFLPQQAPGMQGSVDATHAHQRAVRRELAIEHAKELEDRHAIIGMLRDRLAIATCAPWPDGATRDIEWLINVVAEIRVGGKPEMVASRCDEVTATLRAVLSRVSDGR